MQARKILFFSVLIFLAAGCSRSERDIAYDYPTDVGTKSEHAKILETSLEIEKVAREIGHAKDFHSFPVFVVGKNTPHAMGSAYCLSDASGHGIYIGIRRGLLRETLRMNERGIGKSRLFLILLHEYGHCLFGRGHNSQLISEPSSMINLRVGPESRFFQSMRAIPVSCMYPNAYITELPESLKKYYVSELFGLKRMKTIDDLKKMTDVVVVPAPLSP